MTNRAGLYERKSTGPGDSALSRSVEQQNQQNREAAGREGWRVARRYSDPGLSASRYARAGGPEWEQLRADVRAGRLDTVVLWEPSRGGRGLGDWASFLHDCRGRGVPIHLPSPRRT